MKIETVQNLNSADAELLVVGVPENAQSADAAFPALAGPLFESGELPLKPLETLVMPGTPKVMFIGLAKSADAEAWRRAAATAVRRAKKALRIAFAFGDAAAIAEGAVLGSFSAELYKTNGRKSAVETVFIAGGDARTAQAAQTLAESTNWARQLINTPSNDKPPRIVAERAKEMAQAVGLEVDVLDEPRIRELRMGALLGVSQGSDEAPRVVVLKHLADPDAAQLLALVGKGITFDTGGISLKPAEGMEKMKYDMAGGATCMAVMRTLALTGARVNCIAVVPLAENMPGGRAQRPGDVVRAMSGKTIEVINTDAEGRLVLADGIAYAKQLGATHLIDLATLTGAVRIALGSLRVGVFGNRADFTNGFMKAAERAGERMWQLPLDDEYREMIKSVVADIANSGGRFAGAITAAKFLQEFVGETPWIHLDLAGTAWNDEEKPYMPKGPSGIAVRSLVEFATTYFNG
jgi:leucyl aminopeptidase